MNYLPEGVVQQILSQLNNARDIASSTCVSKQWQSCVPYLPSLFFSRAAFDYSPRGSSPRSDHDAVIGRMVAAAIRLEELVVYCPFNPSNLVTWLNLRADTLRVLELRMDGFGDRPGPDGTGTQLDCIRVAKRLEQLKIWGVSLTAVPKWGVLKHLKSLEIVGATLRDGVLEEAVHVFPNLVNLVLLSCDGVGLVRFELEMLQRCRLDFLGEGNIALFLSSPRLEDLQVQGFSSIWIKPNHRLQNLSIAKNHGNFPLLW
jgi:F-box-like